MKEVVMILELYDDKIKKKAMKSVSGHTGVDSITVDMKEKKLTVRGDIDPVKVATKLRKLCHTEIVLVGPAKEPENKKDDDNKKKDSKDKCEKVFPPYFIYPPYCHYYEGRIVEDGNPNACVIC